MNATQDVSTLSGPCGKKTRALPPLEAARNAWADKASDVGHLSGSAHIRFSFRPRPHTLETRSWSRESLYRVDIPERSRDGRTMPRPRARQPRKHYGFADADAEASVPGAATSAK